MKTKESPEIRSVLDSIRRLVRAIRIYSREAEGRSGLSAAQLFVMHALRDESPVPLKELARRTMTDTSSVSVVVERLCQKGLVLRRRSEKDGRLLELWLSAEGKVVLKQRPDALQSRLIEAMTGMKKSQRMALANGLSELLRVAGMSAETPAMLYEPDEAPKPIKEKA